MKFLLLVVSVIISIAYCDVCLQGVLPVSKGASCSATTRCRFGTFCNSNGVCQEYLKAGEKCEKGGVCEGFLVCKGPTNEKICVKYAELGESCTIDSSNTLPFCPRSCENGICKRGQIGDTCTDNSHCSDFLTCAEDKDIKKKVCAPVASGASCNATYSYICPAGTYCDFEGSKTCAPRKETGSCDSSSECAYGYICTRNSVEDDTQCIQTETKAGGEYCESDSVCQSLRCQDNSCAAKGNSAICEDSDDCAATHSCRCGGNIKLNLFGKCAPNPCYSTGEKLSECIYDHCPILDEEYDNSCVLNYCKSLYESNRKCNGVSGLVFSTITILFFALFVLLF